VFSGIIEFTKKSGRSNPDLIAKEKEIILERLTKAGNFARWGEGRKWSVTRLPEPETQAAVNDCVGDERHGIAQTLVIGDKGVLTLSTCFREGSSVEAVQQDDGSIVVRQIEDNEVAVDDGHDALELVPLGDNFSDTEPYESDRVHIAFAPVRRRILTELRIGELNVGDLCRKLGGMNQSAVSHHLKRLRTTSLVESRRAGQFVYYSLTHLGRDLIENVVKIVN
jgi:DNA-binding transcriptional ArsR family regulator